VRRIGGGADAGDEGKEVKVREGRACGDAVIGKQYALGKEFGIPGTPMIVMGDGTSLGGYVSPEKWSLRSRSMRRSARTA
jgi:protein-disulfide isomerase